VAFRNTAIKPLWEYVLIVEAWFWLLSKYKVQRLWRVYIIHLLSFYACVVFEF